MAYRDRYKLLCDFTRVASSNRSPHKKLKSLATLLSQFHKAESVTIYLPDNRSRALTGRISNLVTPDTGYCRIPFGEGGAGKCAEQGNRLFAQPDALHGDELQSGKEARFFLQPVHCRKELLAVIAIGFQDARINVPVGLKPVLTVLSGILLEMADSSRFRMLERNIAIAGDLNRLINRPLAPAPLIASILQKCVHQSVSNCAMIRLTGNHHLPTGVFSHCRKGLRLSIRQLQRLEETCSPRVLAQNSAVIAELDEKVSGIAPPSPYVCLPLHFETEALGTITFFGNAAHGSREGCFRQEDLELFHSIATLVSNGLAGAASYQLLSAFSAENEKKLKELSLLYRVSNTILSTIQLNKLIHLTLTALTSGPSPFFDRAMLFLTNERSGTMQGMLGVTRETSAACLYNPSTEIENILASRWDISEEEMICQRNSPFNCNVMSSRLELNRSRNVASKAVLEKKLIYVPLADKEKRVDKDFVRRFGITSFAVAPLLARERVVGIIVVDNGVENKPITEDNLRFLQLFTNQAGMAIENSILYNQVEDANRELYEAQERLIQGERLAAIGEMAAGIAHELKTPLVAIGGFARRLTKNLPSSAERESADLIVREVLRLEKMLSDILSFSKKATICYTNCNIVEIIKDALAVVQPSLEERGIVIAKHFPRATKTFPGDSHQLKQIFLNLLLNSQEAMKNGGSLTIKVAGSRIDGKEAVAVKIGDTGGGIPLEALNKIFNPFYTTKDTGTGLGLPIANRIITNHGGKITVNNRPGTGVEFTIVLPLQQG